MTRASDLIVADNLALIDRNRELECELAQLKAKLGRVSRIASDAHAEAVRLSELCGDAPMPREVAMACSVRRHIAEELREAIK